MGGMTVGTLVAGRLLRDRTVSNPLRLYGLLELVIGVSGLCVHPGFRALEHIDSAVYAQAPSLAPLLHLAGISLLIGPAAMAMGATIPVLGLVATRFRTSIATIYAMNTAGASIGVLAMAFVLIPSLGVSQTTTIAAVLNLIVALATRVIRIPDAERARPVAEVSSMSAIAGFRPALLVAFATGFATFALEVAWFRSLRAAFQSTTDSFAIILASVLIPLAIGARLVPMLRRRSVRLQTILAASGIAILAATPLVERFDLIVPHSGHYWSLLGSWFGLSLLILGTPIYSWELHSRGFSMSRTALRAGRVSMRSTPLGPSLVLSARPGCSCRGSASRAPRGSSEVWSLESRYLSARADAE
jgi:MFS family permease